jgi:predicted dehydrogenase
MNKTDGMNYAPKGKPNPVVKRDDFSFAAIGLDHGHIYGMSQGLVDAGANAAWVYDPDSHKMEQFQKSFPGIRIARSAEEILEDDSVKLVASAAVPADRCRIGLRALNAGKHFMSDKPPFTSLEQLEEAKKSVHKTGLLWGVCYSERVQNESAVYAGHLIGEGVIGRVLQVIGLGPHRLNSQSRPDWFFQREKYGGILTDIGSHQIEQFLAFAGADNATIVSSRVANYNHPEYPGLDDFGEANLVASNGASNYFRVDWFTPDGLRTWGDGRTFILGTKGYIELRKYIDIARDPEGDHVYLVTNDGEQHIPVHGKVGFPYFGRFILDCLNGTDLAMPQSHVFKAAELCLQAQRQAVSDI